LKNRNRGIFCKQGNFVNSHGSGDLFKVCLWTLRPPCGAKDLTEGGGQPWE
jgi:hypothetical protein